MLEHLREVAMMNSMCLTVRMLLIWGKHCKDTICHHRFGLHHLQELWRYVSKPCKIAQRSKLPTSNMNATMIINVTFSLLWLLQSKRAVERQRGVDDDMATFMIKTVSILLRMCGLSLMYIWKHHWNWNIFHLKNYTPKLRNEGWQTERN